MPFDHEQHARDRAEVLTPIREEAGYPVDDADTDAFHDLSGDAVMRYIELLEARVMAHVSVAREVGRLRW
jgi:hypothetical protein